MKKRSRLYALALSAVLALTGCAEDVPCSITDEHYHYYHTNSGLKRLMSGEKEYKGSFFRDEEYVTADDYNKVIVENSMYYLEENRDYIENRFESRPDAYRLEKITEHIPDHFGLNYQNGEVSYGLIEGHDECVWQEIALDAKTDNPVKDVTYGILLYRILPDGTLESKVFEDLESIESEYNLFKTGDLITKIEGEEYYLKNYPKKYTK